MFPAKYSPMIPRDQPVFAANCRYVSRVSPC